MIRSGKNLSPSATPIRPPLTVARRAYAMYFPAIAELLKPRALSIPILIRFSSTILVIAVRLTRAATRKKITGNTLPRLSILSAFCLKLT